MKKFFPFCFGYDTGTGTIQGTLFYTVLSGEYVIFPLEGVHVKIFFIHKLKSIYNIDFPFFKKSHQEICFSRVWMEQTCK